MSTLVIASLAFLFTHLAISSTPLRGAMVGVLGENAYLTVYSVLAALTLGAMMYGWINITYSEMLWAPTLLATAVARALMPLSLILLVAGLMARNPTAVRMASAVNQDELDGILKITRHPVQWAIFLWALAHIIANGDQASIIFFGTFALLSGVGTAAMDAKYRAREDEAWQRFFDTTSNVPFAAVAGGRTRLKASDLNWTAIGIGVVLFVLIYLFHEWVSGVPLY